MVGEVYVPRRLRERGVRIAVPIEDPEVWQRRVENDPGLPASYGELRDLVERYSARAPEDRAGTAPLSPPAAIRCGESLSARIQAGLGNPWLDAVERDTIDAMLADGIPINWISRSFDPFLIHWTETDPNPANNFDPGLVEEAGTLLQLAWNRLSAAFGANGIVTPIEVQFLQLGVQGRATSPNGPIAFDTQTWLTQASVRAPLAAHELFHIFQYSFGFRQTWPQSLGDPNWFGEGTARWAEVFVHQRLTAADWLTVWMSIPGEDLLFMGDYVLPFWIFLDAHFRPGHFPLFDLLTSCRNARDLLPGLDDALTSLQHGLTLPGFFSLYAAESFLGRLRRQSNGATLYPSILDPDGRPIDPRPATTSVRLQPGNPHQSPAILLGGFGSTYQAFSFPPAADGLRLVLHAQADQELSFQTISLLRGTRVAATPGIVAAVFDQDEVIHLAAADTLVLIASGRGAASNLDVSAELA
jgi:hypothetical protein